jgi:hypothetical protein
MLEVLFFLLNFFWLDRDPDVCARYHGDKHVHKMITEYAQICSTAAWLTDPDGDHTQIYRPSHKNHPVVVWASESLAHFLAVLELGRALVRERTRRAKLAKNWKPHHASSDVLEYLSLHHPPFIYSEWLRDPPACVPDAIRNDPELGKLDVVEQYRISYAVYKTELIGLGWKPYADVPEFVEGARKRGLDVSNIQDDLAKQKRKK